MTDGFGRRDFLKGAVAGGVAATAPTTVTEAQAQTPHACRRHRNPRLCIPQSR